MKPQLKNVIYGAVGTAIVANIGIFIALDPIGNYVQMGILATGVIAMVATAVGSWVNTKVDIAVMKNDIDEIKKKVGL